MKCTRMLSCRDQYFVPRSRHPGVAGAWLIAVQCAVVMPVVPVHAWQTPAEEPEVVGTVILPAKVRDFKEYYDGRIASADEERIPGGHPDFGGFDCGLVTGAVESTIDTLGDATDFEGDNRNPALSLPHKDCYTGLNEFSDWFNDRDSTVNRSFLIGISFEVTEDCKLTYNSDAFFPLDDGNTFYSLENPPEPTFGHLQSRWPWHNYGFTLEFHTSFTYVEGADQHFRFSGDDDVWVFINDSLVIDLGGVHAERSAEVFLDEFDDGFFDDGETYLFDLFFAERQPTGSHLRIETSILFDLGFKELVPVKRRATATETITCYGKLVEIPESKPLVPPTETSSPDAPRRRSSLPVWQNGGNVLFYAATQLTAVDDIEVYTLAGEAVRVPPASLQRTPRGGVCFHSLSLRNLSRGIYSIRIPDRRTAQPRTLLCRVP